MMRLRLRDGVPLEWLGQNLANDDPRHATIGELLNVGMLERDLASDDPNRRLVHKITEGVGRLNRIVVSLLNYTRPLRLNVHPVNLVELVEEQGFQVELSRYFFHWPFFAKLLIRGIEWLIPGTPGPARVPPGFVNVACRFFTTADEWLYRWAQLPFGTSILLVASRPADPGETEA